jgi:carbamoylphosphate synthase small subunit
MFRTTQLFRVASSVGQQNALFSGVIPTIGTNLGIGLFSGQIPIVANLNTRKITNVIRALDLTESAVATKQLNASLGNMTTSLNVTASQNVTNTVNSTLIQNVTTSLNSTTPQNTTKI